MNAPKLLIAGLACIPFTAVAQQQDLGYTWFEIYWANQDVDELGDNNSISDWGDGDGIGFSGSIGFDNFPWDFAETWFIFANYIETESDVTFVDDFGLVRPADTDIIRFDIGAGLAIPLNEMSHVMVRLAYVDIDIDGFKFGATDTTSISDLREDDSDGYFIDAAWRGQLTPVIELTGGIRYTDIESIDQFSFVGNALFEINPRWGVTVNAEVGDDLSTFGIGARYTWR